MDPFSGPVGHFETPWWPTWICLYMRNCVGEEKKITVHNPTSLSVDLWAVTECNAAAHAKICESLAQKQGISQKRDSSRISRIGKNIKKFLTPPSPSRGEGSKDFCSKNSWNVWKWIFNLNCLLPPGGNEKKINLQSTRGEGGCWPTPINFWWKTFSFKELLYEKSKSRREKKIMVKIAVHLHRCQ